MQDLLAASAPGRSLRPIPLTTPLQVFHHITWLRSMCGIAVLGDQSEFEVLPRRHRQKGLTFPPARGRGSLRLTKRCQPEFRVPDDRQRSADHFVGAGGLGSLGSPKIISPMMFRWICDDPA